MRRSGTSTKARTRESIRNATKRSQKPTYSKWGEPASAMRVSGELDQLLAEIPALQEVDKALRRVLDALHDGFAVLDPATGHHRGKRLDSLGIAVDPVEHD